MGTPYLAEVKKIPVILTYFHIEGFVIDLHVNDFLRCSRLLKRMQKARLVFGSPSAYNCGKVILSLFLISE